MNRREFMVIPAAAMAAGSLFAAETNAPWQLGIRRIGQLNMTEHDPAEMNTDEWADYWVSLKVDVVQVSVTGILAFYQTKVPFHRNGKYLGARDFFGECCAAAKKRGLHVVGRLSPDLNWGDALAAHPEWFEREANSAPIALTEDSRLFRTCMFSPYMTEYIPAIMREVNSLYDVDALFTNAWPPLGRLPVATARFAAGFRHREQSSSGTNSTSALRIFGSFTIRSRRKSERETFILRTSAAEFTLPRTWFSLAN
jgi:Hypothetical glycosyl hydrolase 6